MYSINIGAKMKTFPSGVIKEINMLMSEFENRQKNVLLIFK